MTTNDNKGKYSVVHLSRVVLLNIGGRKIYQYHYCHYHVKQEKSMAKTDPWNCSSLYDLLNKQNGKH